MRSIAKAPLSTLYLALLIIIIPLTLYVPRDAVFIPGPSISDPAKVILDILDNTTKLVVALDTALMGAAATLVIKANEWSRRWTRLDSTVIVLVFACGAASYFGVYLLDVRLLSTVSVNPGSSVNPLESGMLWAIRIQYWGMIAGVALLGLTFTRLLDARIAHA
jgi:hypothetical protein